MKRAIDNFCGWKSRPEAGAAVVVALVIAAFTAIAFFHNRFEVDAIRACQDPTLVTTSVSGHWDRGTGNESTRYIYRCADGSMIEVDSDVNRVQQIKREQR